MVNIDAAVEKVVSPNKVVPNPSEEYIKNPPNNLNLADPSEQDRTNDLIGTEGTEPVNDEPQSAKEKQRVQELADKLNK